MEFRDVVTARQFSPEKMKKVGLFDTPRMFCDLYCFEPGQEQKSHLHKNSDKVYYVLEGEGRFRIGDEEMALGEGKAVLAPAGLSHGVKNDGRKRLALLVFMAPRPEAD